MNKLYTDAAIEKLLSDIGISSVDELYSDVPVEARVDVDLPEKIDEDALLSKSYKIIGKNISAMDYAFFTGDGVYHHYIPPVVGELTSRSEFLTAYTPYQPEISQGVLQSLFEYQSVVTELSGMEVSNSSMYDGASALGEAARMAYRIREGKELLIPASLSPYKKSILKNYTKGLGISLIEIPFDSISGEVDTESVKKAINDNTIGMVLQTPNRFGIIEKASVELKSILVDRIFIVDSNPIALTMIKTPGEIGADIYVGEGQSFGVSMNFGGPLLGLFATKKEYVRKMPGRIIGYTHDKNGKGAFCMTLQTREQHIKREHATSNICTNNALMAITFLIYASLKGNDGLRKVAIDSVKKAHKLKDEISGTAGFVAPLFTGSFFNEFVYKAPLDNDIVLNRLLQKHIIGGVKLGKAEVGEENCILAATTEMNSAGDIELYGKILRDINVSPGNIR